MEIDLTFYSMIDTHICNKKKDESVSLNQNQVSTTRFECI